MQKKNILHTIATLSVALTLSSCALSWNDSVLPYVRNIHQGQTPEEVTSIMKGEPQYSRFTEDGLKEWEYHKNRRGGEDYDVIVIGFRDGRVVHMDSYKYHAPVIQEADKK
ncbi:MAG: hypothetical protein ACOYJK_11025 [Prevotella sp.]|jgi:hypothetical protein